MKNFIEAISKKIEVSSELYNNKEYYFLSYSQNGEDSFCRRYFQTHSVTNGCYVDIGAHHPFRYSNTYALYKLGWRGINIDAMPGSMVLFEKYRRGDINLEVGVGKDKGTMPFYIFEEPALNTFDEVTANEYMRGRWKLKEKTNVSIERMEDILDQYLKSSTIDFLSIDAEGVELDILSSNNWERYRPRLIACEILNYDSVLEISNDKVSQFLCGQGYKIISVLYNTAFFEDKKYMR